MRRGHLAPQQRELRRVKRLIPHLTKPPREIRRRNRRDIPRDIALRAIEVGEAGVVEDVALVGSCGEALAAGREIPGWRVACADGGDAAVGAGLPVRGGEEAAVAEGLQGVEHVGEGAGAVGFEVDPEVDGLVRGCVVDAAGGEDVSWCLFLWLI